MRVIAHDHLNGHNALTSKDYNVLSNHNIIIGCRCNNVSTGIQSVYRKYVGIRAGFGILIQCIDMDGNLDRALSGKRGSLHTHIHKVQLQATCTIEAGVRKTRVICDVCKLRRHRAGYACIDKGRSGFTCRRRRATLFSTRGRRRRAALFSTCRRIGRTTLRSACSLCLARRSCHILRNFLTGKDHPSVFGVVDKHVSVALNLLDDVISAHFPLVNRVKLTPLKQNVNTLENVCNAAAFVDLSAVAYVNVETDSRNVALDIVQRLKVAASIPTSKRTVYKCRTIDRGSVVHVSVFIVASLAVYTCIRRTNVVQIRTRTGGLKASKAFRPNVLSVPHGTTASKLVLNRILGRIEQIDFSVTGSTVHLICQVLAVIVIRSIFVSAFHKRSQRLQQLRGGLLRECVIIVPDRVIADCIRRKRSAHHVSCSAIIGSCTVSKTGNIDT